MAVKTFQELYDLMVTAIQNQDPTLTDLNQGSKIDVIAGSGATAGSEILATFIEEINKTFVDTANGPEVTNGPDYLQALLVDHFGSEFARPLATKSSGIVAFSRANDDAGDVVIAIGTVVKTPTNASGSSQSFVVTSEVTLTGTTINASVQAVNAGIAGNVQAGQVTIIETSLTDPSVVVTNADSFTGGEEIQTDAEYRETFRRLLQSLRGATLAAIKATAENVPGVEIATGVEFLTPVKEWDIGNDEGIGDYFYIGRPKLFIADANGTANQTLIDAVKAAIEPVRAAGPQVEVIGATAVAVNWSLSITLNPSGPNYASLSTDKTPIIDTMRTYLQNLATGDDFIRTTARAFLLSVWGPSGSDDVTAITTSIPTGDVAISDIQKVIPGTLAVV